MKAVVIRAHGGPEVMQYGEIETPKVGPNDVLIKLEAVGVNRFDVSARRGDVPYAKVSFPHVLGVEGAGRVVDKGNNVATFDVGDRVMPMLTTSRGLCRHPVCYCAQGYDNICADFDKLGLTHWGTYAEYVKVTHHNVIRIPDKLSSVDAAAGQVAMATAWELAMSRCKIRQGETVLVNAAGGAVGSAAVQIARLAGARVIASAGSDEKLERAKQFGADAVVNYNRQNLLDEVKRLTGGRGVDAVIESVGGTILQQSIEALVHNGRLATAGSIGRAKVEIDIFRLLRKQIWLTGTHFAPKETNKVVLNLLAEGKLRPVLARLFPLADAPAAHQMLESRDFVGNMVLQVAP
ncbi:MAG: zinc-binding dehydrogenase [Alphaproteobacteria bacterium]|nr:zinc-binding dehydrogenase [Alphaproteobacteria bacterium]